MLETESLKLSEYLSGKQSSIILKPVGYCNEFTNHCNGILMFFNLRECINQ